MKYDLKIADSMLDLIGDIPLVRLNRVGKETEVEILVKPEFLNPSGSIKDRIAREMIEDAERKGLLREGSTIIEATTGNTGTALAFVAAVKGYKMKAFSPGVTSNRSRMAILTAFGAESVAVNIDEDNGDASQSAKERKLDTSAHGGRVELLPRQICMDLEKEDPMLWWARQFSNPCNVAAHRDITAKEILEQTGGRLDAFVASIGTGGTLLGVAQTLKAHDRNIRIVGVEPEDDQMMAEPSKYPMIPGISDGIIPQIFDSGLVDAVLSITNQEAIDMAHILASKEGIFCGMSSGANVCASLKIAREIGPGKRIVTVLPDSRDRYLEVEKYTT